MQTNTFSTEQAVVGALCDWLGVFGVIITVALVALVVAEVWPARRPRRPPPSRGAGVRPVMADPDEK